MFAQAMTLGRQLLEQLEQLRAQLAELTAELRASRERDRA